MTQLPDETIVHMSSPLTWRGGEQQLFYLYTGLKERGLSQIVFCPRGSVLSGKIESDNLITYKKRSGFDLLAAWKLKQICRKYGIRILHAHDAHSHTTAVLAATLYGNSPSIILSRRVDFPIRDSWFTRYKYNHQNIQRILCVSNAIKNIIQPSITRAHIRLETVYSGVDINRFKHSQPGKLREELGIPAKAFLIGNVAALADHKDYSTFLETVRLLFSDPSFWFVVIGSGPLESELKALASSYGLNERLIFAGFRVDVDEVMCDLDLLLFTSKTEGLGTSVLDAFANRIPVVATSAGGIQEMVIDGKTGRLCPVKDAPCLANAVRALAKSKTKRDDLVQKAYASLTAFSVDSTTTKTLAEYEHTLSPK